MAPECASSRPRILYLDAYDSFSNNIIAQVEHCIGAEVVKCPIDGDCRLFGDYDSAAIDDQNARFFHFLRGFDAVVAGPGPGWAECDKDVGLMKALWSLTEEDMLPILGICLGFQSMCLAFGAGIERLRVPRHGIVAEILHCGQSIFSGVEDLVATQYHSLQVEIGHQIQLTKSVRYPAQLWEPTEICPDLEPLAWDFDSKKNGAVLMAAKHSRKPFWGVQFHPESICTNEHGLRIVRNWWMDALSWRQRVEQAKRRQSILPPQPQSILGSLLDAPNYPTASTACSKEDLDFMIGCGAEDKVQESQSISVHCFTTGSGRLTVADVVETFNVPQGEAIVLESGLQSDLVPIAVGTGRHSIVGLVLPGETPRIHYYAGTQTMQLRDGRDCVVREWQCPAAWQWIRSFMGQLRQMLCSPPSTTTWAPFWGGLMGYASYEAGLETIDVKVRDRVTYPDICFAYITRSIVIDHKLKKIYVQSIRGPNESAWARESWERLNEAAGRKSAECTPNRTPMPKPNPFEQDSTINTYLASCAEVVTDRDRYCDSVAQCQAMIADGQSYELCLTSSNQVRARKPRICRLSRAENNDLSWKLYKKLALQNPAPFAAYVRLHNIHVLSSSPERYISWDRAQTAQCRPIKGTVAKKPGVTFADAHAILSSSKERAENLMIVDLVRHQLHGVYGSGQVHVRRLMEIEEYKTVWQLVSVVEGVPRGITKPEKPEEWEDPLDQVSDSAMDKENVYQGYDAFVQSLPPGSMTGAPKKRSCEILQNEEGNQRRGIYSGVLGYLDIGGGGDFSVVIRTAVKIEDSTASSTEDIWTIGAGGAITTQSTPESEYDEMLVKLQSTAKAFKPQKATSHLGNELKKLDNLAAASAAMRDGGGAEGQEGPDDIARTLLGTLENFRAQLENLERETLVLTREPR